MGCPPAGHRDSLSDDWVSPTGLGPVEEGEREQLGFTVGLPGFLLILLALFPSLGTVVCLPVCLPCLGNPAVRGKKIPLRPYLEAHRQTLFK